MEDNSKVKINFKEENQFESEAERKTVRTSPAGPNPEKFLNFKQNDNFSTSFQNEQHMKINQDTYEESMECDPEFEQMITASTSAMHGVKNGDTHLNNIKEEVEYIPINNEPIIEEGDDIKHEIIKENEIFDVSEYELQTNEQRKFACQICSKIFKTERQLQRHSISHSDERQFPCDICPKKFKHKQNIQHHLLYCHNIETRRFTCEICSEKFKTKSNLEKHSKNHNNEQYSCNQNSSSIENDLNNLEDPGLWPELNDSVINYLITKGPKQVKDIYFPCSAGRRFKPKHYCRILANGDVVSRSWLVYSVSKDAIFCFCCKIMSKNTSSEYDRIGYCNWTNLIKYLKCHDQSTVHIKYFQQWKELELRLQSTNVNIDFSLQKKLNREIEHWKEVLKRLIAFVEFFSVQSLPLRSCSDELYDRNNDNFLKLIESIAKFDPFLSEYSRRIENVEQNNTYLTIEIQNELIEKVASVVNKKIMNKILEARYYSIIVDCTPNQSRTEQLSLVIRIVGKEEGKFKIEEFFLGFLLVSDATEKGLTELVLNKLSTLGLLLSNCRGQGYDNGSNMKAKNIEMQVQIKSQEPRVFFVPCATHSTKLILSDSAKCSSQALRFFETVQNLYTFFSISVSRWAVLNKNIKNLTLKPMCTSRWECCIDALRLLIFHLEDIYEALVELSKESDDAVTRHTAESLGNNIFNFEFICSLLIWFSIIEKINEFSKYFQSSNICFTMAIKMLESIKIFLINLRSDERFEKFVSTSISVAEKLNIETLFSPSSALRSRKRSNSYEEKDEIILDPKHRFKIDFYFKIIDQILQLLNERLDQISEHNNFFKFLYDIYQLRNLLLSNLKKYCTDLETYLSNGVKSDINGLELYEEFKNFLNVFSKEEMESPLDTLNIISSKNLEIVFPNLVIALKIMLTIPITVASGEQSHSKLKTIQNYLRNAMPQERLENLATISIEKDFLQNLQYDDLINDFAKIKAKESNFT